MNSQLFSLHTVWFMFREMWWACVQCVQSVWSHHILYICPSRCFLLAGGRRGQRSRENVLKELNGECVCPWTHRLFKWKSADLLWSMMIDDDQWSRLEKSRTWTCVYSEHWLWLLYFWLPLISPSVNIWKWNLHKHSAAATMMIMTTMWCHPFSHMSLHFPVY